MAGPRVLRLDLTYDGSGFKGWQRQPDARTVQGEVEAALARILGAPHAVVGCGRTDAGVHARQTVASLRTEHAMDAAELARALDAVLPDDVGVVDVREAAADFHAQRDAIRKWYRYTLLVSRRKRPLDERFAWRVHSAPALASLAAAAAPLEGRHDFRSFANHGSTPGRSTVRTLHVVRWQADGSRLHLDVQGDGFLYKMVRTIVGTLRQVAQGPRPAVAMRTILDARDRCAAGPVAPGRGLCLMAVAVRGEAPPDGAPDRWPRPQHDDRVRCDGA